MKPLAHLSTAENTSRYRRSLGVALLISLAVHALAFLAWRGAAPPFEPAREASSGPAVALDAGGAMQAIHATLPRRVEIPPPPRPKLSPDAPRIEELTLEQAAPAFADAAISFPGGGAAGRGESVGTAAGAGGGGDDLRAPYPRALIPQWEAPRDVKGVQVTVRVHVDAAGMPTGEVQLEPPTPNGKFNDLLRRRVREMRYYPARRNGNPVPGWAEITFIF